ncbi:MAG TPA: DUF2786 domain-containing protein [Marmoricola sp.]
MHDHDPRLAKIRKLLAQAEDPAATPAEAVAFTAKATELIAAYGIDAALLDDTAPDTSPVGDLVLEMLAPYAVEKSVLAFEVTDALRCHGVRRRLADRHGTRISLHVFGRRADLECLEMLFTSLLLQGTAAIVRTPVPWGEHVAAFRRTWWLGFAGAVGERLREAGQQAVQEAEDRFARAGTTGALVLADHAREAEEALRAAYPDVVTAAPRRLSGGGARLGWQSGQRADLGTTGRVGGSMRGQIAN